MMAQEDEIPVRTLLLTVFESIAEVFLLCLAGYILSKAGVTDKATQRKLNVINVSLFTPALLFSKVAYSLTPAKLKEMWTIPVGFCLVTGLSAGVAWIMSTIFKLNKSQRAFAVCATMFQNSNSLPIALIQSLVVEVPGLKWDDDDSKDQMLGRALTYLVLYSTLGMMLRWSVGVKLLSQADDEVPSVESAAPHPPEPPTVTDRHALSPEALDTHPGNRETDPFFTTTRGISQDETEERASRSGTVLSGHSHDRSVSPAASTAWIAEPASARSSHPLARPPFTGRTSVDSNGRRYSSNSITSRRVPTRTDSGREFWGLPDPPRRRNTLLYEEIIESDSSEDEDGSRTPSQMSFRRRAMQSTSSLSLKRAGQKSLSILKSVHAFMTVPMYAALLSIVIAMIPPLQAAMSRIKPVQQAVKSAGQCSIPVTLVVLGAFFYTPPAPSPAISLPVHDDEAESPRSSNSITGYFEQKFRTLTRKGKSNAYPGENKAVFVAVVSRMFIVPAIMMPILAIIAKTDPFEAAADPVFILSAVLLVSSPPALTLAQITQAASGDAFERLISKTITWSYAILTPPLTLLYVVLGLVFGRL